MSSNNHGSLHALLHIQNPSEYDWTVIQSYIDDCVIELNEWHVPLVDKTLQGRLRPSNINQFHQTVQLFDGLYLVFDRIVEETMAEYA